MLLYKYSNVFVVFCATVCIVAATDKCKTPNGEIAECVSIHKCPILLDAIQEKDEAVIEFATASQCGYDKDPLVCCGKDNKFVLPNLDLLPSRRFCGLQHSDDYYHSDKGEQGKLSIDEFPWLAALFYSNKKDEKNLCAGTLINSRYVLTTAHCLNPHYRNLTKVRLGEYNIDQQEDCVSRGGQEECTDPIADFGIEEIIRHEDYNSKLMINDVALLRLNKRVNYSDYIRPICLPLPGTYRPKVGDTLSGSGWGSERLHGKQVKIKKKILVEIISNNKCQETYRKVKYTIQDSQMCTVIVPNATIICQGDSGAPVLYSYKNQWFQEGMVEFGPPCDSGGPDVHLKVAFYLDWILKNIRA